MKLVNLFHAPALLLCLLVLNFSVQCTLAWFSIPSFDAVLDGVSGAIKTSYKFVNDNGYCALRECCNEVHIHSDITELRKSLEKSLFGQHIAAEVIVNAVGGHFKNINSSEKPLVMSLHGLPGTGKNFIAEHITRALYKNGANSQFVHKYLGRIHFPLQSEVETYKLNLVNDIKKAIARCPKSLFIFDEVEKMPSGLFDSIVTLLDHHAYTKHLDFRQSIFLFLSNVAGPEIADKLKGLVDRGVWREETKLHDYESTLEIASYNLMGGLHKSELIESHVVDHFVPFLPLELRHVESCIRAEYAKFTDAKMSDELLSAVVKEAITFDETGLYSNTGCKRVNKKVEALYYSGLRKQKQKQEL
ncbi:torsin-like protein [Anopheles stephensi]|uniref:torsin-like protein n=1 Tax=Anopheles stephensi TaxID=30069 RepID=UPI001658B507|nr:torsin-like protein [Anopheles stephensi]XP_035908694.1 torsin-like protein [Anopheles stephensi]XP_035908695.1 torsin-like protein [Anopheles stephensi]